MITDNLLFLTREEVHFQTESIASYQSSSGELSTENNPVSNDNHHVHNATREYEIRTNRSMEDEVVHVEITVPDGNNDVLQNDFHQEQIQQYEEYSDSRSSEQDSEQSVSSTSSTESGNSMQHEAETDLPWSRDISGTEDGQDSTFLLLHREEEMEWHAIESHEEEPQWQLSPSLDSTTRNRFSPPEDDVYGVELRELLSR